MNANNAMPLKTLNPSSVSMTATKIAALSVASAMVARPDPEPFCLLGPGPGTFVPHRRGLQCATS
jgi:hypothetical protein